MKFSSKKVITIAILLAIFAPTPLLAEESNRVYVTMDDIRQVVAYNKAIEAENAALKSALSSERESTERIIAENSAQNALYEEQIELLNAKDTVRQAEIKSLRRKKTFWTVLSAVLAAGVITLTVK